MTTPNENLARLEAELRAARLNGARALRELHARLQRDLAEAEQRASAAEKKAQRAERLAHKARRRARRAVRRAGVAETELAAVHASATWKAGRAVVAVPARLRGLRGKPDESHVRRT